MATEQRNVRYDTDLVRAVQELADDEHRTWSAMANLLLAEALEARQRPRA